MHARETIISCYSTVSSNLSFLLDLANEQGAGDGRGGLLLLVQHVPRPADGLLPHVLPPTQGGLHLGLLGGGLLRLEGQHRLSDEVSVSLRNGSNNQRRSGDYYD